MKSIAMDSLDKIHYHSLLKLFLFFKNEGIIHGWNIELLCSIFGNSVRGLKRNVIDRVNGKIK